ncbi:MAG: M24 family metallopeptidase [Caldimicrobium sp.]
MLKEEIEQRIKTFQRALKERNLKGALLFSPINIFYFTSLFIKGFLFIGEEEVGLYVKRPYQWAKGSSFLPVFPLDSLKILPEVLTKKGIREVGVDFRALNFEEGKKIEGLLSSFELISLDDLVWECRKRKSDFEIVCMKRAAQKLSSALKKSIKLFKLGMKEITASALLERALRESGHPGFTRSYNNFELTYGYLISGKEGLFALPYATGEGGKGVEGFPGGATFKKLRKGEPILIDFSGFYKGYYVDQTRMASFGRCKSAESFFNITLEILKHLEKMGKPGIPAEELYFHAEAIVEKHGVREYFMCHGERLKFIGHGVGLEIDEPPVIAPKNKIPLQENMVLALEPKFHLPWLGVVGLEDTFLVTKKGLRRLTTFPREWIYLGGG